jgi:hypothetical protein
MLDYNVHHVVERAPQEHSLANLYSNKEPRALRALCLLGCLSQLKEVLR